MSARSPIVPQQDLLSDLTDPQREAVTYGEGPLLILAGAGSGKTRVITRRVAHLLQQGVRPSNILAITFTNKAAGEMRKRVESLVPGNRVWVCTFHSLGVRLLRQYADRLNLDRNFTIYDVDDRNRLIKEALSRLGIDDTKFSPDRVGSAISHAKNQLLTPKAYEQKAHDFFSKTVATVYFSYEKRLRAANGMDFDDLLYLPAMAMRVNEELRAELDARFRYVLIDEYQDTNMAQYEIARKLSIHYPNLSVVGDPDQSIYKWRGSDIKNILDFERDFPSAKVITLAQNYRSTKAILHAADAVIAHNKQRKKKELFTENPQGQPVKVLTFDNGLDEADGVVVKIKESVKAKASRYRDHAVFLRINALSRSLESAFVKHGVPFQIVRGLSFFERKENKDVIAYLRLLTNPQDTVSFLRVVNEPVRGIGKVSLERLKQYAEENECGLLSAAAMIHKIPEIKGKAATGLRDFHKIITELRTQLELPVSELIPLVLDKTGYRAMLVDSKDPDDSDRLANIEELITAAKQFQNGDESRTLPDFLEQISLASDTDNWDESSDVVSVMTLHAAKGLEFPVVHMLAMEQGLCWVCLGWGLKEDIEEERRLCYVGMTRAMRELYLCHSRTREFRGQIMYAIPSNFLEELPKEVEHVEMFMSRNQARGAFEEWRSHVRPVEQGYSSRSNPLPIPRPVAVASSTSTSAGGDYAEGQVVQHEEYGVGKITHISGYGALRKVKIRFAGAGEKTFIADKVKLKVVKRA